jgi:signal transduction histidine kinase
VTPTPLRALVVEDQVDDADLLVRELTRGGFAVEWRRVDTAQELEAALDEGPWDVVFADYTMPRFRGTAALRLVRQRGLDVPFIFVSGTIGEDLAIDAMRSGANDYVIKGSLKRLVPAVERELRDAAVRRDRLRLEGEVAQAQRLESVGRLAGGLAHDFNNLLTVVLGNAELLLANPGLASPLRADVDEIRGAAERARELTRGLLAFSRRQVLDLRPIDLNGVVDGILPILRRALGEDLALDVVLASDLGTIRADVSQLEQVLVNLVVNARDAMPEGGRLTIETSNVELDDGYAAAHVDVAAGPYVQLSVSDTGTGMDTATLEHIFEPFFTTKPEGEGTGLGLATVYGIVKQSGGHIWPYTEVGRGTTFRVYFPRVDARAEPVAEGPDPTGPLTGTEHVLVVEDDAGVRRLAARALREQGYTVHDAATPAEALVMLEDRARTVDLLLTDAILPGMDGKALAQRARGLRPELRILFMSGYGAVALARRGVVDAGQLVLEKPFTAVVLARKVREALDHAP